MEKLGHEGLTDVLGVTGWWLSLHNPLNLCFLVVFASQEAPYFLARLAI